MNIRHSRTTSRAKAPGKTQVAFLERLRCTHRGLVLIWCRWFSLESERHLQYPLTSRAGSHHPTPNWAMQFGDKKARLFTLVKREHPTSQGHTEWPHSCVGKGIHRPPTRPTKTKTGRRNNTSIKLRLCGPHPKHPPNQRLRLPP